MIIDVHSTLSYYVLLCLIKKWGFPTTISSQVRPIYQTLFAGKDWLVHRSRLKVQNVAVKYRSQRAADVDVVGRRFLGPACNCINLHGVAGAHSTYGSTFWSARTNLPTLWSASNIFQYHPDAYRSSTVCETANSLQNYKPLDLYHPVS